MKTIIRLDTDDQDKLNEFKKCWENNELVVVPKCDEVEIWIVDDNGNVVRLDDTNKREEDVKCKR